MQVAQAAIAASQMTRNEESVSTCSRKILRLLMRRKLGVFLLPDDLLKSSHHNYAYRLAAGVSYHVCNGIAVFGRILGRLWPNRAWNRPKCRRTK